MHSHNETPPLTGSIVSSGGSVVSKAVAAENYLNPTDISSFDFAARAIAARHRLHIATAREICRLAQIGGLA